jgi:triacylglycerol esterase/lipase EstA (alpha/beta hydrolase family)
MSPSLVGAWALLMVAPPPVAAAFVQVAPVVIDGAHLFQRTPERFRAVVLVHGLRPHPFKESYVPQADRSVWEEPSSPLVRRLGQESDVFAFSYGQNVPVGDVSGTPELAAGVGQLRALGYEQIVLVGYSAGAIISREFVEDEPDAGGVTKVIQVCPPNGGSAWAGFSAAVRKSQGVFVQSLAKEARQAALAAREGRVIPPAVEFVCLVGSLGAVGDGLVRRDCQWTPDLQQQGVPAVLVRVAHPGAMLTTRVVNQIAELVREPQPRWSPAQVEVARKKILGESDKTAGAK